MKMLLCDFGKAVQMQLINIGQTKKWLIDGVSEKTGLYFDRYYLHRILTGQSHNQKIIGAIKEILEMEVE